ncbi:2'-5' RNA ligase superfamily protein [Kribbella sp. VKM Ac-2527]|uniref:2'-5' RNA ligase superfamily protein n=1 Tax=Kribbella caucasensis TaxID=2512215 RepID=A0A4R6IX85_9ACTN|nr:2'-5' RNA ligase family protein [Kribbella sp. VKM Ac-2527]TDO27359.1 2'-5' RNA ligase superfamily protein [Kribbella sp. VKM Ac-2527]
MTDKPEWMWRHATELRNHWWWRPGWQIGTRFYAFHLAVGDCEELAILVARYQDAIGDMVGFDPIPREWLHLTMQGLAFVDDISPEDLASVVKATRAELARVEPFTLAFNLPLIRPEALVLVPEDVQPLNDLRNAVRSAIEKVLGQGTIDLGSTDFQPHVSFAYVNADRSATDAVTALEGVESTPAHFHVGTVPLIEMHRDNRMYEWRRIESMALRESTPSEPARR